MNTTGKVIIFSSSALILGALALYVRRQIKLAKAWDFNVKSGRVISTKPFIVEVGLEFINESDFQATIKDVEIQVFSQGIRIGSIDQPNPLTIARNGSSVITFSATVDLNALKENDSWQKLVSNVLSTLNIPMDFIGKFKVKTPFGYISQPVEYSTTGKDLYQLWKTYYG
jgi:LEA14-like dessication related protein